MPLLLSLLDFAVVCMRLLDVVVAAVNDKGKKRAMCWL